MGPRGPPADPRALHLQDPGLLRPAAGLQRAPARAGGEPRGHDLQVQGGRRAAPDAGDLGAARDLRRDREHRRLPALPAPRPAGDAGKGAHVHRGPRPAPRRSRGGADEPPRPAARATCSTGPSPWCWCRSPPPRARPRARPAPPCWSPADAAPARSAAGGSSGRPRCARAGCWRDGEAASTLKMPLGPAVGQCCGGNVTLELRRAGSADVAALAELEARLAERLPLVLLFGAGHVGRALARALAPLPLRLRWIDSRAQEFPDPPLDGPEVVLTDRAARRGRRGAAGCGVFRHDLQPRPRLRDLRGGAAARRLRLSRADRLAQQARAVRARLARARPRRRPDRAAGVPDRRVACATSGRR